MPNGSARVSLLFVVVASAAMGCDVDRATAAERSAPTASAPAEEVARPRAKPEPAKAERLVVIAGGDVNLGRSIGQRILRDGRYDPFRNVAPLLERADLAFVNLESQLSSQARNETMKPDNPLVFTGPEAGADVLARAGIDVVSTANNHAWDYGKPALDKTIDNLRRVGIAHSGTSSERGGAFAPVRLEVRGWKIAIVSVTEIWNQGPFHLHRGRHYVAWADIERVRPEIERAKRDADLVLISYHGGSEYVDVPMQWTHAFAKQVMEAGATAFIGHHPHVPHGVGWYEDKPILFSLGNFVFEPNEHRWTSTSFLARFTFHASGGLELAACPFNIVDYTPEPFAGKHRALHEKSFRRHFEAMNKGLRGGTLGEPDADGCMTLEPPSAGRGRLEPRRGAG